MSVTHVLDFYPAYLVILLVIGITIGVLRRQSWKSQAETLRNCIYTRLNIPPKAADARAQARQQILALAPGVGQLPGNARDRREFSLWICFTSGGVLLIYPKLNHVFAINRTAMKKLAILDNATASERGIAIETEQGLVQLKGLRLDDMVRIINVCISFQIVVGYRSN